MPPNEIYLSIDDTCRDLLTRESSLLVHILPSKAYSLTDETVIEPLLSGKYHESKVYLPEWTQGTWRSTGTGETNRFHINQTQLTIYENDRRISKHQFTFVRTLVMKQGSESSVIRLRAKTVEQW